jgi:hypothetical protein
MDKSNLIRQYMQMKSKYAYRDGRMAQVMSVREGRISDVAPGLFPDDGPFQEPITANMIDVAARDLAEMIAPLPAVNCISPHMVKDKDRERADIRTKVVQGYVTSSDLQTQAYTGIDLYLTCGFLPAKIDIDYERETPIITIMDPQGCYPVIDRFGRVTAMFQKLLLDRQDLVDLYPEYRHIVDKYFESRGPGMLEVMKYHDKDVDICMIPELEGGLILHESVNPIGQCLIKIARRPGPTVRGQFDDVLFVQLAKARMALLAMEAAHKSVQAPLVVPTDVPNIPLGPDAVIRTSNPAGVGRVALNVPRDAFSEQAQLDAELRIGTRYPEVRTGNADSSVITGRGVQALMGTMDTQVRTAQAILARWFADLFSLCLEVDEKIWPNKTKTLQGRINGTPFEVKYKPSRDIAGDTTVDVQYGLMAGLDPNRWLVFGLQARGEKLISRDYLRRQMPADLDATQEEQKVDIEDFREALKQAMAGYAQAIPVLAQQGQDPQQILSAIATVIEGRRRGIPIEETIKEAFAPPEEENAAENAAEGGVEEPGSAGGGVDGLGPTGLLKGVAPGQAGMAPGGRPDLQMMLAGLNAQGQPNLTAAVSRRSAI